MKIEVKPLLDGAKNARGIAVVIDVFRAFSLECYMYAQGVKDVFPVESLDRALKLKEMHNEYILFGERMGMIQSGFDYGNSPYYCRSVDLTGKSAVHASSSGTRGLIAALDSEADIVITGSFVNAAAIARYIKQQNPETVTLIPMGWAGEHTTLEDDYCADYIISLLNNEPDPHPEYLFKLYETDGKRFFNKTNQQSMPIADFFLCLEKNIFNFILKAEKGKEAVHLIKQNY